VSAVAEITDLVRAAIDDLAGVFTVRSEPTGDGGAIVTVCGLSVGPTWTPTELDLAFEVAYNYPHAAIYPYYTTETLARADGAERPSALARVEWRGVPHTQISLRANRWDPAVDTALGAVVQVQQWFLGVT
jgi:hypothetical protein